ncbi:7 transmembrane receptor (rhodopsin) [Sparganum proliferum]
MEEVLPINQSLQFVISANDSQLAEELPLFATVIRFIRIPVWCLILCFGLFGNVLTVLVLRSRKLRQSSSCFYLTVLAITDILYLLTSLLASIVNYIFLFPLELRQKSAVLCVITPFLHYTLAYISVWLLVAVTVERAIWVVLPFRARRICTDLTAKITVTCFILGFTLTDSHFFFTMKYQEIAPGSFACIPTYFADRVFPFYDLLFAALLPCFIMLIANIMIGIKLRSMRKFRSGIKAYSENGAAETSRVRVTCASTGDEDCIEQPRSSSILGPSEPHRSRPSAATATAKCSKEKSTYLTKMLVSTNVFFIISVTPLLVYDVIYFAVDLRKWAAVSEEVRGAVLFALETVVYTLWYTNFAIHFLLYCLSGPPFRLESIALLSRCYAACRACLLPGSAPVRTLAKRPRSVYN